MKKVLLFGLLLTVYCISAAAQKRNYVSVEAGMFFGNTNQNLVKGMNSSGLDDDAHYSFIGIFDLTEPYPQKLTDRSAYRIRFGRFFKDTKALEAGFGRSFYGEVAGYDDKDPYPGNFLYFTSSIHTLYGAYMMTDSARKWGFGIGPAVNFYSLTRRINGDPAKTKKNYLLPGAMITGYWNFISKRSWFIGVRTDMILTVPASIDEIKIVNASYPDPESTFKATRAASFNGSFGFLAGIRF